MIKQLLKQKITIFILIILEITLAFIIYIKTENEIDIFIDNKIQSAKIEYNVLYAKVKEQSEMIFQEQINIPSVINLFKNAQNADKIEQDIVRKELYENFKESYHRLNDLIHLRVLHFHFSDNKSFLRVHKPNKFGDDLTNIRSTVEYVNKNKKPIDGFEAGRIYHGFRFIYPLFDDTENYLGSVDTSFSIESFKHVLDNKLHSSQFIISKSIIDKKVWKNEENSNYVETAISSMFLINKKLISKNNISIVEKIQKNMTESLKAEFSQKTLNQEAFALNIPFENTTSLLTFLPVKNPVTDEVVAYIVLISEDNIINSINKLFWILQAIALTLILIIFIFIYRNQRSKDELIKSESKYRTIIENTRSNYFFYSYNNNKIITYVSESITDMLGYEPNEFMINIEIYFTDNILNKDAIKYTQESLSGVQQPPYLIEIYHKDGSKRQLEVTETPIFNKQGELTSIDGIAKDITQERRINQLIGNSQTILFYWRAQENWPVEYVSKNIMQFGYSVDEFISGDVKFSDIIYSEDLDRVSNEVVAYTENQIDIFEQVYRIVTSDNKIRWIDDRTVIERNSDNEPIYYLGTIVDITEQKLSQIKVKQQHEFLQNVIDGVADSIMVIDKDYTISMMNKKAKARVNYDFVKDKKYPKCHEASHNSLSPCDGKRHPCPMMHTFKSGEISTVMHTHKLADGTDTIVEVSTTPLKNEDGEIYAVIETAHDITSLLSAQSQVKEQAQLMQHSSEYDSLTDLPNRTLFLDRLSQVIKSAKHLDSQVAVLFIDLDHFKEINDSMGHHIGDEVLKEVSIRLSNEISSTDTLARLGGDEFAIILSGLKDSNTTVDALKKLLDTMTKAIKISNQELYTTLSIGVTMYPEDGLLPDILLKNADAAMYKAKEDGRNTYRFYNESMTEKAFERIVMESSLRNALLNEEFVVHYQPQVDGDTSTLIGMEALVRWNHPTMGLVSPAKFIPLAEEIGLIVPIDRWVMKTAMKQMVQWYGDGLNPGVLALNLAIKQLQQDDFIEMLSSMLKDTGCKPQWLELEVTEGQIMNNPENAILVLNQINDMEIELAIDDFGTGYSSLSYLKRLPIDKLKIDQSFIRDLPNDEEDAGITKAVISLAQSLHLRVIAEGVETKDQKEFLVENGCKNIQGYFYSKPIPANELEILLKDGLNK